MEAGMQHKTSALILITALAFAGAAVAQEDPADERGVWVAQINPTSKDMFVTDCPCEVDGEAIEMTCKAKSGVVRIEMKDFLTNKAKLGDKAAVSFDIDGQTSSRDAAMASYTDGFVMPAFEAATDDPLFSAIAAGRSIKATHDGTTITSPLKGSKKAMATMLEYCAK
jgi:hypothetical protein